MKQIWEDMKAKFMPWMFIFVFGFGLGKMFTYSSIATDCRVLGVFRIADKAFDCRLNKAGEK